MSAKKALGRQLKALNKEAGMEYKYTQDVTGAIFGNLGTTLKGTARSLGGIQAGQLAKLQALRVNSGAQQRRIVSGAGAAVRNRYGSAIAGAVAPAQHALQVGAKAAAVNLGGTVKAGGTFARGNAAAMSALQTAAGGAASAAKYENAQAYAMRNQTNAAAIAAQQFELEKMKYANELDIKNAKAKLALQDQTSATGASALAEMASSTVPDLLTIFNDPANAGKDSPDSVSAVEATTVWAANNGVAADDPEYSVVLAVARAIRANDNPNAEAISAAVQQKIALMYGTLTPEQVSSLGTIVTAASSNWVMDNTGYTGGAAPASDWKAGVRAAVGFGPVAADNTPAPPLSGDLGDGYHRDANGNLFVKDPSSSTGWKQMTV